MPLYHTMGVRSLIAISLIGGTFVCLPRYDARQALATIQAEKITNLYLVPTLYHDLVHNEAFAGADISSVRKLGFAGGVDDRRPAQQTERGVQAGAFRQSLRQFRNLHLHRRSGRGRKARIGRKAGINQHTKVVKLNAQSPNDVAAADEVGQIIALLAGDKSFEGYWRRPNADSRALRGGWYFTGDTGYVDKDGDHTSQAVSTT